jgi:integrase/recombinase XerD
VPIRGAAELHGFAALLDSYLDELQGHEALRARASLVLPRLAAQLERRGRRDLRSIEPADLVAFVRHLATVPKKHAPEGTLLAAATQGCYVEAVRRFFAWLTKRGVLLSDPAHDLPVPKPVRLPRRVLSEAEAQRLMAAPSRSVLGRRDRAVLEVLYGCGLRRGECLRLDLVDLDLAQRLLLVRNGKGKKDRLLPLTGQAAKALDLYLQESRPELLEDLRDDALFLSKYGRRMGRTCLYLLLAKHARAARLRGAIYPHALRHSYATHLLKGRASVRHVQELLGHQSLQSTAVYTRVGVEDLREVLARCHPRERRWRPGK